MTLRRGPDGRTNARDGRLDGRANDSRNERGTQQHIPIVALTAHAMKHDQDPCIEAGMDGFLSKPFQPAELYRALEGMVER